MYLEFGYLVLITFGLDQSSGGREIQRINLGNLLFSSNSKITQNKMLMANRREKLILFLLHFATLLLLLFSHGVLVK